MVEEYLRSNGPSRASEIAAFIMRTKRASPEAARQIVSRAKGAVRRLEGIRFEKGEKFLFLEDQLGSARFSERLIAALVASGTAGGRALRAIRLRGGTILAPHFAAVSGAIVQNRKGHIRSDALLSTLTKYKVLTRQDLSHERVCIHLPGRTWDNRSEARFNAEAVALGMLKSWATKLNLASFRYAQVRGAHGSPEFGGYQWDLVSPSYLAPLQSWSKQQGKLAPGFIVADVCLESNLSLEGLSSFVHKVEALQAQKQIRPFIPLIVAESFEKQALQELRNRGYATATTRNLFGKEASELLGSLEQILTNAAAAIVKDPQGVFGLFERLQQFETDLQPMRGPLFEYIVGNLLYKEGFQIDMNRIVKSTEGLPAEIDVKAKQGNKEIAIECKGFAPGTRMDEATVKDWLERQVPRIRSWHEKGIQTKHADKPIEFHFYFSGTYDPEIKRFFNGLKTARKKYKIEFFDYSDISKRLKEAGEHGALKTLDQYFLPDEPPSS